VRHNRIRVLEDKRYDYDAHGRVTQKRIGSHTVIRFKWNSEHQLIETATERNGARQYSQYTYDALGRRIGRNDAFGESEFLWDGLRLLQERRNHRTSTYVYQPGSHEPLARIDDVDAGYRLPEARADVYHFHNHINGAPEELTNEAGEIIWQGRYGSWGNLALQRVEARLAPERGREGVISPQPLRMQGQYEDVETGLYYNTFRYYDPDIGRFISEDPIGLWGGTNLYQFAPNADGWVDPWGWVPCVNGGKPPKFGNFKDHARRHGGAAGMSSAQYKLNAMSHSRNAQLNVKFRHNGQEKMAHVSRIPDSDMLVFTSTTRSGGRIFTHMPEGVSTGYLNNLGITLPKGF
jgi:RHS repeat-associated protein